MGEVGGGMGGGVWGEVWGEVWGGVWGEVWGGVSHHAKLSNPRVGAVRGLLKRTCRARAPMCTCVYVLSEEFPFTRRSGAGRV